MAKIRGRKGKTVSLERIQAAQPCALGAGVPVGAGAQSVPAPTMQKVAYAAFCGEIHRRAPKSSFGGFGGRFCYRWLPGAEGRNLLGFM